jgi:hypothetical protein
MTHCTRLLRHLIRGIPPACMWLMLLVDALRFLLLCLRPSPALAAENLFLRKQLALYQERHIKPQRTTNAARLTLIWLARCFDWWQASALVQPATFTRWHRQGFRLFWQWKSTLGRPPIPTELRALIRRMARDNPSWGEERITNELLLKLGLRVSRQTVRKYPPQGPESRSAETRTVPRLADLCAQSCQGDRRVRPLRGGHGDLSLPLCVCDHGTRDAQNPAHHCDRSSHGVMDPAQLCDAIPANHPEARSMLEGVAPPGVRGALAAALCSHQGPAERGTYPVVDANPYLRGRKGP